MGRPLSGLDEYRDWEQRLERYKGGDLDIEVFCLQEGVSRSTFYRWVNRLKDGIPESIASGESAQNQFEEASFLPIALKASPVEIELPNGGVIRLPLGVGQNVLVSVLKVVGSLRPWRSPNS